MKKQTPFLSLLAFCSLAASLIAAGPGPEGRDEIERSFQVRPGGLLNFDADIGNVEIITAESERVRVEYTLEYKVKTAQEVNELRQKLTIEMGQTDVTTTTINENNVKVVVRLADDRNGSLRNKVRLDFRITMPRKFNLDLRTGGSAKVGDLDGTVKASTMGGSLKLDNVSGAVTARTMGGSIAIGDVGADLEARSSGGSVATGRVNGRVVANADGGSVAITEASGAIEATANGGSVAAYISKQPNADSKITANAGSIELRLPPSAAVNVDAACTAGRISSDFSLHGHQDDDPPRLKTALNGGGPLVLLRATAGNIHLRK